MKLFLMLSVLCLSLGACEKNQEDTASDVSDVYVETISDTGDTDSSLDVTMPDVVILVDTSTKSQTDASVLDVKVDSDSLDVSSTD